MSELQDKQTKLVAEFINSVDSWEFDVDGARRPSTVLAELREVNAALRNEARPDGQS